MIRGLNPSGGEKFRTGQNGSGDRPTSYTMDTGSFRGVKRQGFGVYHPLPFRSEVEETEELYFYYISETTWPVIE
jgi:hypothetical protein